MASTTIMVQQLIGDNSGESSHLRIERDENAIQVYINGSLYGQTADYETARKEITEYVASVAGEMFDKGMAA